MPKKRFISPTAEQQVQTYHCISRVVNGDFVFGEREKRMFVAMMRKYETFSGVQILAFCVMSNHFHILVSIPPKKKNAPVELSDDDFLRRIKALYSAKYYRETKLMLEGFREKKQTIAADDFKARYTWRMNDLSQFLKGVKQRFTQWYNGEHKRKGTLWESRFKSILVEDGYAARVMAAYIDLNPIRAGIVAKPEAYPWSSYGQAMNPKPSIARSRARAGITRVLEMLTATNNRTALPKFSENPSEKTSFNWRETGAKYRMLLFADGEETFIRVPGTGDKPKRVRKGFHRDQVQEVLDRGGKLSFGEMLRCRVRHLTDGMVLGSKDYVNKIFTQARDRFSEKRPDGARRIKDVNWHPNQTALHTMRQLVKCRIG